MSPALEDFSSQSSSSTQRSFFQNPNPSAQGHFTDSGIFDNSFNLMKSSKLDFDCSNDAAAAASASAATVRSSSRRKHVKAKKQSSCNGSVSKKPANSTGDTSSFVFSATSNGSVLNSSLGQIASCYGNDERQRDGEVLDPNLLQFTMGATNTTKLGDKMRTEEVQNSGINSNPGNFNFVFGADDEKVNTETASERGTNKFGKLNGMDFVFGVNTKNSVPNSNSSNDLVNSMSFLNLGSKESHEAAPSMNNKLKPEANNTSDSIRFENLGFVFSANHTNLQTDSNIQKQESKEKVDKSVPDSNSTFVFGSNSNSTNPFSDTSQSKVSHETNTSNIPDPTKAGTSTTNNFSFSSKVNGHMDSFTGFNTPDLNIPISFTSDMFPGLGKKLEFSINNSVTQRKSKKTKPKFKKQSRNLLESEEVPQSVEECSPMDVSPYNGADCAPTSTNPTTSQVQNEGPVGSFSFGSADVAPRQRPHQKKHKLRKGRVNVSHAYKPNKQDHIKTTDQETCDSWRKRGNEAYKSGDLTEAEACYTKGISVIQHSESETGGDCIEPLLLCYSNRAATRMALGRMREGLKDCRMAASLNPNFLKGNLRSANCHLLVGEIEDALYYYNKCLDSKETICLDRRIVIEAADGLQKSKKVAEYIKMSKDLLEEKTFESATNALRIITDALSISCYSEKLLNLKGDALLLLGKHKEVIQLCEQTLDSAEKNSESKNSIKLWRWALMSKSYFHLGKLELALDIINKIVGPDESLVSLSLTIRELLHSKNLGNEAFQSGKHKEAVEHYTSAISKSIDSHSFAAVCFCNRAAAHQSLGEILDAIGDCSIAIALDKNYPKALSRRATLLEMIRDYKHASDDLQRLISILQTQSNHNTPQKSSSNASVKDLKRARRRLLIIEEKAKKERSLHLYLILGVKNADGATEVKKAYRKAALRHHPDKVSQQWKAIAESIQMDADRLFKMIGEAYAVLSDSTRRSKYDMEEEMWEEMEVNVGSSNRRGSDYYGSQESRKSYGNSHHYYWQDPRKTYHSSYPRW